MVIGLDPGPTESALVVWDGRVIRGAALQPNEFILERLYGLRHTEPAAVLAIEKIASYGMAVGAEVFETVYWSGRFAEAYGVQRVHRITRGEVKMHLCHSMRAKDANVRTAICDRFGGEKIAKGRKAAPGPLYVIAADLWSALAVALTVYDLLDVDVVNAAAQHDPIQP